MAFAVTQGGYRWYLDGTESGATAAAAQNTALPIDTSGGNVDRVLRVLISETGSASTSGATTDDWQLQYSKNGGAFTSVTTSTSNVQAWASSNLTDAGTTTQRLTGGGGSFVAGEISETGLVTDRQLTANNNTEMLYTVRFVAADLAPNDVITFRVLYNGATTLFTYTQTPRATIALARAPSFGSLALAGALVGLAFGGPNTGALILDGPAPEVIEAGSGDHPRFPDVAALVFNGPAPELHANERCSPAAGVLAITGQAPAAFSGVEPDVGTLVLSGQLIGLAFGGPNTGALIFDGPAPQAPTGAGSLRTPNEAALALTGSYVDVVFPGPEVGTLSLTGHQPTLGGAVTRDPGVGALALSGTYVEVVFQGPEVGALALTGHAPALLIPVRAAPGVGALVLTGPEPAALLAGAKAPAVGTLVLAGPAPTLQFAYRASPAVGALALSGQTPAALQAHRAAPTVGALALGGQTPTRIIGAGRAPAVGTLTLSGTTPTLAHTLAVASGALVLTGPAPEARIATISTFTPAEAGLALTGPAPALAWVFPSGGTGALLLTGPAPTVAYGVPVGAVALTLTGQTPTARQAHTPAPAAGTLTLTGPAPVAAMNTPSAPAVGALALDGPAPSLGSGIGVPVGALTLFGRDVFLGFAIPTVIPIESGALVLTGAAPTVSTEAGVPVGALVLTGPAPGLATTVGVPVGALTLTGAAAPTTAINTPRTPGAAALVLTGAADPTLPTGVGVPSGALTLAGPAPQPVLSGEGTIEPEPNYVIVVRGDPSVITVTADVGVILVRGGDHTS